MSYKDRKDHAMGQRRSPELGPCFASHIPDQQRCIAAPETTITLMGSLLIDTTILTRAASTTWGSMHMKSTTILYPMPTGGAFHNFELSALAFAIVGGAIGMIFVKL